MDFNTKISEAIETMKFQLGQFSKNLYSETYYSYSRDKEKHLRKSTNNFRKHDYVVGNYEPSDNRENYGHLKQQKECINI